MGKRKRSSSSTEAEESSEDQKKKKKKKKASTSSSEEESESGSDSDESSSNSSSSDVKKKGKKDSKKKGKKDVKKKGKKEEKKSKKGKAKGKKDKKAVKGKTKGKSKDKSKEKNKKEKAKDSASEAGDDNAEDDTKAKKKKKTDGKSKKAKKEESTAEDNADNKSGDEDEQSSDPEKEAKFTIHQGISPGGDVFSSQTTVLKAKRKCAKIKELKGFSHQGEDAGEVMLIFFKDFTSKIFPSSDWTCYKMIDEESESQQPDSQNAAAAQKQDDEDGDKEDEEARDDNDKIALTQDELERQAREREAREKEAEDRENELKAKWEKELRDNEEKEAEAKKQALIEKWERERLEAREKAEKAGEKDDDSVKDEVKSEDDSVKGEEDESGPVPIAATEEAKKTKEELDEIERERRKEELAEFQGSTTKSDGGLILSIWKEDIHVKGHHAVWGSWYDADWGEWGYACCQQKQKGVKCTGKKKSQGGTAKEAKFVNQDDIKELTSDSGESSGEDHWAGENRVLDFSAPPAELKPRAEFGGSAAAYVDHFVRYYIGLWRKERLANPNFDGYTEIERECFGESLAEVEKAITPLLWRLKSGKTLERGEGKWKSACRETRTGMEGKHVKEHGVLFSIDQMATFAADCEYAKANFTYTKLTFGNKMWNLTHVSHVAACTMKGAREYRRNRDSLNTYDMDPVSQKYMHAMKKIIQFAQKKNPSEDMSKNVIL